MVAEGRSAAAAQTFAGLAHELPGPVHAGTDEPPVSLDDFASDDHRFDISWSRPEHHDCHRVAEPIEMEGAHVDDGDIGLLAWGEAADLVVKTPHPRAVESRQSKHVALVEVDGRDLLSPSQCWGALRITPCPTRSPVPL